MNAQTLRNLASSKSTLATAAAILSGSISAVITYKVTRKRLDEQYREIVNREIIEARRFYSALNKRDAFSSPELVMKSVGLPTEDATLEAAATALSTYKGRPITVAEDDDIFGAIKTYHPDGSVTRVNPDPEDEQSVDPEHTSVFSGNSTDTLKQYEIDKRDPRYPYVITAEEFGESEFTQVTLTYYDDDSVLADDKDVPIDDIAKTVGVENLTRFGEGSGDSRVVYVRNETFDVDFEVILHQGNYSEIVHGITKEPRRKPRKFKDE